MGTRFLGVSQSDRGDDPSVAGSRAESAKLRRTFGGVLRELRGRRGLSQEDLGFDSGYHRTYISLLERGHRTPSLEAIFELARALGVEPVEIVRLVQERVSE